MQNFFKVLCLALPMLMPLGARAQTSPAEAQELPLEALAGKLLGDFGALMMDVERPSWGPRYHRLPESIPWPPERPPPLRKLRFYSRAAVARAWPGLCASDWVTVWFEETGNIERVDVENRFGVEGNLYASPASWNNEQSGATCSAVQSTRGYFPAPDEQAAHRIARYVDVIAGRGPFAGQDFKFSCSPECRGGRAALRFLELADIDRAREVDCKPTALTLPSCYELTVGEGRLGPFPMSFRVYGSNYLNRVVVEEVSVMVGFTME